MRATPASANVLNVSVKRSVVCWRRSANELDHLYRTPPGRACLDTKVLLPEQAPVYADAVINQPQVWEDAIGSDLVEQLSLLAPDEVEISIIPSEYAERRSS